VLPTYLTIEISTRTGNPLKDGESQTLERCFRHLKRRHIIQRVSSSVVWVDLMIEEVRYDTLHIIFARQPATANRILFLLAPATVLLV
jgi:hypothetical protein